MAIDVTHHQAALQNIQAIQAPAYYKLQLRDGEELNGSEEKANGRRPRRKGPDGHHDRSSATTSPIDLNFEDNGLEILEVGNSRVEGNAICGARRLTATVRHRSASTWSVTSVYSHVHVAGPAMLEFHLEDPLPPHTNPPPPPPPQNQTGGAQETVDNDARSTKVCVAMREITKQKVRPLGNKGSATLNNSVTYLASVCLSCRALSYEWWLMEWAGSRPTPWRIFNLGSKETWVKWAIVTCCFSIVRCSNLEEEHQPLPMTEEQCGRVLR
ncbi:hypothetical protein J6590_052678 [Homalodisca vitripennis]|nr:hypothetical protein J6590_052678 [Homalodisca vitripennis]